MFCKIQNLFDVLSRKKIHSDEDEEERKTGEVKLVRVLGLIDLTMLGVGATLGVGVYVLAGSVAKNQAGPAVIISFFIAAIASLFSALCYSEFASKVSKSGSAYYYTYLSIGEFAAFIIGWNLVLEYIIGTATEAKAIANSIDTLFGNIYQKTVEPLLPIHSSFLSSYPDFIAALFVVIITSLLSWGVKESTKINNIFTFFNLLTVGSIIFSGLFKINIKNWNIKRNEIPRNVKGGNGGFMPFGINGIIAGAAKCFFGFVGFDGISTTGEETKNPKRDIPLAIILSLVVVFFCYLGIAVVLTLILPYYEQNADAPFPHIFDAVGWPFMKWAVTTGSLFALFTAMFGAFFPLPRILYSMSRDGLLYQRFSYISSYTKTPLISTVASGLFTAVMSAIFKLDQLVDMMSIGTLLAYIIVAMCVLLLRYCDENHLDLTRIIEDENSSATEDGDISIKSIGNEYTLKQSDDLMSTRKRRNTQNGEVNKGLDNLDVNEITSPNQSQQFVHQGKEAEINVKSWENIGSCDLKDKIENINLDEVNGETHGHENNRRKGRRHKQKKNKFLNLLVKIFNLNKIEKMTPTSQIISKVCIYVLITITILVCFILNNLTYNNEFQRLRAEELYNYEMSNETLRQIFDNASKEMAQNERLANKTNHEILKRAIAFGIDPPNLETIANKQEVSQSEAALHDNDSVPVKDAQIERNQHATVKRSSNMRNTEQPANPYSWFRIALYVAVGAIYACVLLILSRQPQFLDDRIKFKVPLVPLVPLLSIFMNLYLMLNLDINTWVRFVIWLAVGGFIYFTYSIYHSKQKIPSRAS